MSMKVACGYHPVVRSLMALRIGLTDRGKGGGGLRSRGERQSAIRNPPVLRYSLETYNLRIPSSMKTSKTVAAKKDS